MKKIIVLLTGTLLLFSSCGTMTRHSSSESGQRFADGIYNSSPAFRSKEDSNASKEELQSLVEKTKSSQVYLLFGDKRDTVVIPENMAATIRFDKELGTSVTVASFDPYDFNGGWHGNRYGWNSGWYFGGCYDWYYSAWNNPWYYGHWRYSGWYDPWYCNSWYGGWYDPWYGGFYDPWYGYMRPHYCGWYGGWDPYYHHHHHIPHYPSSGHVSGRETVGVSRLEVGSDRVVAGGRITGNKTGTARQVTSSSRGSFGTSRSSAARSVVGRGSATSARATASASRATTSYRRPSGTVPRSSGSTSTYTRGSSPTSGSTYDRGTTSNSQTYSRGSASTGSSYSRSYSAPSRSSYSSGSSGSSYSRSSSYGGGGGYSRSSSGSRR